MAQSIVVYGSFLVQLYAYCWFGSELTQLVNELTTTRDSITQTQTNQLELEHNHKLFQAHSVRDTAWSCDWVGLPVSFQRSLVFIIAVASKDFTLTAGKFVPVSRTTMLNVRLLEHCLQVVMHVCLTVSVCPSPKAFDKCQCSF
jgi:hypothetical protein